MTDAAPVQSGSEEQLEREQRAIGPVDKPTAWQHQYRVLKAIVLRDLVARYAEYRLGFLLSIIMPLITIGVIMLAFGMRSRAVPADFSMPVFLATGFPLWLAFIGTYGRVVSAASKSDALMMFPQITQLDVIIASVILEFAINTAVFTVLVLLVSVFARSVPRDPAGVMLLFWSCTWLGAVFGLIMCSIGRLFPLVINILNTFLRFGMWVSGVVFMVDKMPVWSWKYLAWNPILHAVEGTRQQWSQTYQSPIFSPGFLLGFGCFLTIVGMLMERASRRFVH